MYDRANLNNTRKRLPPLRRTSYWQGGAASNLPNHCACAATACNLAEATMRAQAQRKQIAHSQSSATARQLSSPAIAGERLRTLQRIRDKKGDAKNKIPASGPLQRSVCLIAAQSYRWEVPAWHRRLFEEKYCQGKPPGRGFSL